MLQSSKILGWILVLIGAALVIGPLLFYRNYHKHFSEFETSDFFDDSARKMGTVFFVAGGVSLVAAGIYFLSI